MQNNNAIEPLYIWAGGKRRFADQIIRLFYSEAQFHSTSTNNRNQTEEFQFQQEKIIYAEPFFGAGAVFCRLISLLGINNIEKVIINDINPEIMGIYTSIKSNPERFIQEVLELQTDYIQRSVLERKQWFFNHRKKYWQSPTSSLLYFLMSTCFNGIWQSCLDSNGLFGTPPGLCQEKNLFIDVDNIRNWSNVLQKCQIFSEDFESLQIPDQSLVYCDPPYIDSFTTYGRIFDLEEQKRVFNWCKSLSQSNRKVILQNKSDGVFFESMITSESVHYKDIKHTAGRRKKEKDGSYTAKNAREMIIVF